MDNRPALRPSSRSSTRAAPNPIDPTVITVSDLSVALIREFLVAKGHRRTLEVFGQEEPLTRKETRLSSRAEIVKLLGIGKLIQGNREAKPRLESFLEVITQYLSSKTLREKDTLEVVQKSAQDKLLFGNGMDAHQTPLSSARTGLSRPLTSRNPVRDPILQAEVNPGLHVDTGYRPPILGAFVESNPKSVPPLLPVKASGSVSQTQPAFTIPGSGQRPASGGLVIHDLDIDELNLDSDEDLSDMKQSATWAQSKGSPLSTHTIQEVLEVIFPAKTKPRFGEEWTGKGFVFRNSDTLRYGLVQTKGGPCGLLAAVQAHVLKFLLFSPSTFTKDNDKKTRLRPSPTDSRSALIYALTDILHQASSKSKKMVLIVKSQGGHPSAPFTGLEVHEFVDKEVLKDFLEATISQFMMNGPSYNGIIQFLLSLTLTRGIHYIRQDMDESDCRLMGRHGYCTQEMVNLVLVGAAISNVHDLDIFLGGEPGQEKVLKGIKSRSQFGQLSLLEHYQNIKVGDFFKNPGYPIWIICSESHYSILFSIRPSLPTDSQQFDLFYYDGLANQEDEIRLTLSPAASKLHKKHDLVPPLEHCIHTKWGGYKVDWNGTEPLL